MKNLQMFTRRKIQDLSLLPPCQQSIRLYFKRSNYVAKIWKTCLIPMQCYPSINEHGWSEDGTIVWTESILPDNIYELLLNENENDSELEDDSEGESEEDEEY